MPLMNTYSMSTMGSILLYQVFLKYYHIEQLSHKFEDQQRRVVLAQAVMKMWVQKRRFRRQKEAAMKGAVTIQKCKHVIYETYGPSDFMGMISLYYVYIFACIIQTI